MNNRQLVCQINSKDRCYKSYTVSTAWWGAWQINNSSFIRLINRILILQIAFFKKKKNKVQARGTIRKINSSENWSWHKKNYFHCKSSKTGLFLSFWTYMRTSTVQISRVFVLFITYTTIISRVLHRGWRGCGGALKMWYFNRVYICLTGQEMIQLKIIQIISRPFLKAFVPLCFDKWAPLTADPWFLQLTTRFGRCGPAVSRSWLYCSSVTVGPKLQR